MTLERISAAWFAQEIKEMEEADQGRTWGTLGFASSLVMIPFSVPDSKILLIAFCALLWIWMIWGFFSHANHKRKACQILNTLERNGLTIKEGGLFGDPFDIVPSDTVSKDQRSEISYLLR